MTPPLQPGRCVIQGQTYPPLARDVGPLNIDRVSKIADGISEAQKANNLERITDFLPRMFWAYSKLSPATKATAAPKVISVAKQVISPLTAAVVSDVDYVQPINGLLLATSFLCQDPVKNIRPILTTRLNRELQAATTAADLKQKGEILLLIGQSLSADELPSNAILDKTVRTELRQRFLELTKDFVGAVVQVSAKEVLAGRDLDLSLFQKFDQNLWRFSDGTKESYLREFSSHCKNAFSNTLTEIDRQISSGQFTAPSLHLLFDAALTYSLGAGLTKVDRSGIDAKYFGAGWDEIEASRTKHASTIAHSLFKGFEREPLTRENDPIWTSVFDQAMSHLSADEYKSLNKQYQNIRKNALRQ